MSLYLGGSGRSILKFVVGHSQLYQAARGLSKIAGKIIGEKYTPGITLETFRLHQALSQQRVGSQKIEMRRDAFFIKSKKVALNPLKNYFPDDMAMNSADSIATIQLKSSTPESLAEYIRTVRALVQDYKQRIGKPTVYSESILPLLLERANTIEELKEWDGEVKALILDYKQGVGFPKDYIRYTLPRLLEGIDNIDKLSEIRALIKDYIRELGDPREYAQYILPILLQKTDTIEELKGWDNEIKALIRVCNTTELRRKSRLSFNEWIGSVLSSFLKAVNTVEELREANAIVLDYSQRFKDPSTCVHALTNLFIERIALDKLREARSLIQDYAERFGDPVSYIMLTLPDLLSEVRTVEELRKVKALILDYSQKFGNPEDYINVSLPRVLREVDTAEKLEKVKELILDYSDRFGDPSHYIFLPHFQSGWEGQQGVLSLPVLLKEVDTVEEFEIINPHILRYSERVGNPMKHVRATLPDLVRRSITIDQLREEIDSLEVAW